MFIHVGINAKRANQDTWGDTRYATDLANAIRAIPGCDAEILYRDERPAMRDGPAAMLRIVGPHLEDPVPGLPNMVWMISPPNLAPFGMLARFQAVFSGSALLVERLRSFSIAASYLPQATETSRFQPGCRTSDGAEIELSFVGSYAPRIDRRIVLQAVEAGFKPQIWGPGWADVVPAHLWRGERLDADELAQVYARSHVVLNSHMTQMARLGFMSNRSYDALSCGAMVVSDTVAGFSAPNLPELMQAEDHCALKRMLDKLLSAPRLGHEARMTLHQRVAQDYGFGDRAARIVETARKLFKAGRAAAPAFQPLRSPRARAPRLTDPAASADTACAAALKAALEMRAVCRYLERPAAPPLPPPEPAAGQGVIHPLMTDQRQLQMIAASASGDRPAGVIELLAAKARRVVEALQSNHQPPFGLDVHNRMTGRQLESVACNKPLWTHGPEGFNRDIGKTSLRLWPRRQAPGSAPCPAVILHLYHADLAPVFAERLQRIPGSPRLYVSTDTAPKAEMIRKALPEAEIRVLENRGRDIWPKLYGFRDAHERHEIVLHLHGKKSPHSGNLDEWLAHILDCLLGSPEEIGRILSFFDAIPLLGMVVPGTFRPVLGAAHWGENRDIAREVAYRIGMNSPLPDDAGLRFPVGSMFWARSAALRPLLDLDLQPCHFPPESGQVDGTLAHAIERMLGVVCRASGYHLLPVISAGSTLYAKYQQSFTSNGEVRRALESGAFDG